VRSESIDGVLSAPRWWKWRWAEAGILESDWGQTYKVIQMTLRRDFWWKDYGDWGSLEYGELVPSPMDGLLPCLFCGLTWRNH
jgi:hypothetical protein